MNNSTDLVDDASLVLTHRVRPAQAASGKAPCLVLLHGVGANEAGLIEFARKQDPRLVVILARGPITFGPQQFGWFQVRFGPDGPVINATQAEQSRRSLLTFIGQLPDAYGVDPARIWIAGFSQGGIMSASVGLTSPEAVAGFGLLSGRILPEILPLVQAGPALTQLQAFISHGVQDEKLGIHFARKARALLQQFGVPAHYVECEANHELNDTMQRDFCDWIAAQLGPTSCARLA
jgi:phospholipase/carboxylesterase